VNKSSHNILREAQADYLDSLLPPRDPLRARLEALAAEEELPIATPDLGHLLEILARASCSKAILEIGTCIGYGTLCLARGATEARITTIDRDPAMQERARELLAEGEVLERIDFVVGEALEVLPGLTETFDLVYLDCDKKSYRRCLDLALQKLRVGGLVVVDNLLWRGEIAEPPADGLSASARAVETFNSYFMIHPQLRALVLPLGDGVGVGTKLRPLITDLGGPY
jgi:caffeoyl-CoA O-methyltransferase